MSTLGRRSAIWVDNNNDFDDDSEPDRVLFMAIKLDEDPNGIEESEDEGEVDLEAELVHALKELKKVEKENWMLKEEAQGFEQTIVDLKTKLEEAKRIEDSLTVQLMENIKEKENREVEIVSMKNKL